MSRPEKSASITRRSLLKTAALSSGAAMVPGILGAATSSSVEASEDHETRFGLLLTEGADLSLSSDVFERELSRRLGIRRRTTGVRGTVLRATTDGSAVSVRQKLEELFHDQGADRVLCHVSNLNAPVVGAVASTLRRPVTMINGGAHLLDPGALSEWLQVRTHDLFGRNRELAAAAAAEGHRRGLVLVSSHEAGYGTAEAIRQGFEGGAGVIERYHVIDSPLAGKTDLAALRDLCREVRPDVIFLLLHADRDHALIGEISSTPSHFPAGITIVRNVSVGKDERERLIDEAVGHLLDDEILPAGQSVGTPGSWFVPSMSSFTGGVPVPYT